MVIVMNRHIITSLVALAICFGTVSCNHSGEGTGPTTGDESQSQPLKLTPIGELNSGESPVNSHAQDIGRSQLRLNRRSYVEVGKEVSSIEWPNYARINKLSDGSYMLFCQQATELNPNGFDTFYLTSPDLVNWSRAEFLFERHPVTNSLGNADKRLFTNANAIVLSNGDVLAFASYRANAGYATGKCQMDNGIIMKRSSDNGKTWSEPVEIYHGTNWEAHMLQLPSGQIQCYFSESRPWISAGHSGTAMILSDDNGATWSPALGELPYTVIRQTWANSAGTLFTDQMPVVTRINDSDRLAAAIESSVTGQSEHCISFAYSDADGQWPHLTGDEVGPEDRNNNVFTGAAPYLIQFPSGESILSYGLSSRLYFRMGDASCRNFSEPFLAFADRGSWGGMEMSGSHELIAAMRNSEKADAVTIMLARFVLNHGITATKRTVRVDGDNSEWQPTDEAIFVGSNSQAQATLRCSADQSNIYFLVEVIDEAISRDDYVNILLSPMTASGTVTSEARRIKVSYNGLKNFSRYAGGWSDVDMGVDAKGAYDGTISVNSDTDNGYLVEIAMPRSAINITDSRLLVNLVLVDTVGGEDAICSTSSKSLDGWIPIEGL